MHRILSCPICGSQNLARYLKAIDHTTSGETFTIERCAKCKFLMTNPQPDPQDLGRYYESSDYISHSNKPHGLFARAYGIARQRSLSWKLKTISKYCQNPESVLDLGCGTGDFLAACRKKNLKIQGVEPSPVARKIAEEKNRIQIDATLESEGEKSNVITAWHVVEHIADLQKTIKTISLRLNENGTIFIAVPNHESYDAEKYAELWAAYDVPRHLWHFNKSTMTKLFSQNGFVPIAIEPMKLDSYYVSLLSEKYKRKNLSLTGIISAMITGLVSNLKARKSKNHSSLLYVFRKK
jgi:SAM-dependent methyltransferase